MTRVVMSAFYGMKKFRLQNSELAFTLIELLVVIAIIAILARQWKQRLSRELFLQRVAVLRDVLRRDGVEKPVS